MCRIHLSRKQPVTESEFLLQEHETARKLASLQRIVSVTPHPNADSLEIVRVLGWNVIAKLGEYKPGDLTIFCEIDSVLPAVEEFEFLANKNYRIKTIKLRGLISQGICIKPSTIASSVRFPDFVSLSDHFALSRINEEQIELYAVRDQDGRLIEVSEGSDLTAVLNIVKYTAPIPACLAGNVRGNFPSFIPKTDEDRVQNIYSDLIKTPEYLEGDWEATIKIDGTSFTAYFNEGDFGVCSRNWDLKESDTNTHWKVANSLDLRSKMTSLGKNIAIQGELYGEKIQGNKEGIKGVKLAVFNVFDIDKGLPMSSERRLEMCKMLQVDHVPIIEYCNISTFCVEDFVNYANGPSLNNKVREGVVFKSRQNPSTTFKVINPQWLLAHDE